MGWGQHTSGWALAPGGKEAGRYRALISSTTSQSGRETELLRTPHVKGKIKAQVRSFGAQWSPFFLLPQHTHTVLKLSSIGRHVLLHGSTELPQEALHLLLTFAERQKKSQDQIFQS